MRITTETKTDRVLVLLCLYTMAISLFLLASSWLGAHWLRVGFAGLPLGAWLAVIGGLVLGWHAAGAPIFRRAEAGDSRRLSNWLDRLEQRCRTPRPMDGDKGTAGASLDPRRVRRALSQLAPQHAGGAAGLLARFALAFTADRPLRIGCTGFAPTPGSARDWPGGFGCELIPVTPAGDGTADRLLATHRLDAWIHVRQSGGECDLFGQQYLSDAFAPQAAIAHVLTPQRDGKPAASLDFGGAMPAALSRAFPLRVDAGETIIRDLDTDCAAQREALLDFAFVQAALSRAGHRLTLSDLWGGRHPWQPSDFSRAVGALLHHEGRSPIHLACARLVAAWFGQSGHAGAHGPWVHGVLEATGRLRTEAAALLQRGAAYAANRQYDESVRAFIDAMLRLQADPPPAEPANAAFLQFNLEPHRRHDPAALGQLAASITVLLATSERELRRYVRQDIEDDVAQARWIGEDEDAQEFLHRLIERLVQLPQQLPLIPAA